MKCSSAGSGPEMLIAYAAGTLARDTELLVEHHIALCSECRHIAEQQKLLWATLDIWEPQYISSDFDRKLQTRIAVEQQRPWYRRLFDGAWSFKPAVPVVAAGGLVFAAYFFQQPSTNWNPEAQAVIEQRVDFEQVERALDDIDMLKQLGVVPAPSQPSGSEPM